MDSGPNKTLLSMDSILLATTHVSGNETLLSIVDESVKEALVSTRQHILFCPPKQDVAINRYKSKRYTAIIGSA